jgi:hypothetical protein
MAAVDDGVPRVLPQLPVQRRIREHRR